MQKNIVLIGFMGSGKSSTGQYLAEKLRRACVSTDALIEQKEKKSIEQIFSTQGEPYFRQREKETVAEVARRQALVIDCGGGVVLDSDNMKNLGKTGIIVYLETSAEWIYSRVKNHKHRPLLNVEDPKTKIKEMLKTRTAYYEKADFKINTDGKSPGQVGEEILKILAERKDI